MKVWAIGAFVAALASGAAAQTPDLTGREVDALPPAVLSHRVMDQLADTLSFVPTGVFSDVLPLSDLFFMTRPAGTHFDNLCGRDKLQVFFHATGPIPARADTPARAVSLAVTHSYVLLARPSNPGAPEIDDDRDVRRLDAACTGLAPDDKRFFTAPDAWNAGMGASAYLLAVEDAQVRGRAASHCERVQAGCLAALAAGGPANLSAVGPCAPDKRRSNFCWDVQTPGASFRIQLDNGSTVTEIVMQPMIDVVVTSDEPRRLTPLPEGEGGAQSEANGRVRGYGLSA